MNREELGCEDISQKSENKKLNNQDEPLEEKSQNMFLEQKLESPKSGDEKGGDLENYKEYYSDEEGLLYFLEKERPVYNCVLDKYITSIIGTMTEDFETKEELLETIEKIRKNPQEMKDECEKKWYWSFRHKEVNIATLFEMDYGNLVKFYLINSTNVSKESFEEKYRLHSPGLSGIEFPFSIKEYFSRILEGYISMEIQNRKTFKKNRYREG